LLTFTSVEGMEALLGFVALDVSANRICAVPRGLRRLPLVEHLDLSGNAMRGRFPGDFSTARWDTFVEHLVQ
jgi:hypothetical protein